jgi:hypothetical protein
MSSLILYPLLTAALWYLGTRATITNGLWSRYPEWFAGWADCAACSGAWYGVFVALVCGQTVHMSFLGLNGASWYTPLAVGLCSMVWTPIVAAAHAWGLWYLGSALENNR